MIRKTKSTERIIDLDGPEGNAFFLLGTASRFLAQLGFDKEKVLNEMRESDYTNLVRVFDKYFGSIVVLETNQESLLNILE